MYVYKAIKLLKGNTRKENYLLTKFKFLQLYVKIQENKSLKSIKQTVNQNNKTCTNFVKQSTKNMKVRVWLLEVLPHKRPSAFPINFEMTFSDS